MYENQYSEFISWKEKQDSARQTRIKNRISETVNRLAWPLHLFINIFLKNELFKHNVFSRVSSPHRDLV